MEEPQGSYRHNQSSSLPSEPPLNIVLIGEREAGKSAAGNAILGTMAFDQVGIRTKKSLRREGLVKGRQVVVVDTPGWDWFNLTGTSASPAAVRKEMVTSMSLCHPGAHALLLVIPLSFSFSGRDRRVAEEHVELFGPRVWNHTLVLFTVKDPKTLYYSGLKDEVETNIELQILVEKCGGRYHALHGKPRRGEDLVAELLSKIQEMVSTNGGSVLFNDEILEQSRVREEQEERREEEERRKEVEKLHRIRKSLRKKEMQEPGLWGDILRINDEEESRRSRRDVPNDSEVQEPSVISRCRQNIHQKCNTQ
ncbi:GTPase IMAP family member 4-like [Trichomycterus rosablanca]|uniref:GTPase IMAP family member 4-like n=1 Tax=Trichomycterus rosablanca TaxID=2290929 RepID=UPI002F35C8D5